MMANRIRIIVFLAALLIVSVLLSEAAPVSAALISPQDGFNHSSAQFPGSGTGELAPWGPLPNLGLNGRVHAMVAFGKDLYVGGSFTGTADGKVKDLNNIARLSRGKWLPLPHRGLSGGLVNALQVVGNGLYVGGAFTRTADGTITNLNRVARFEDGTWSAVANFGLNNTVETFANDGNDLYVGGNFTGTADGTVTNLQRIAKLSDNAWSALPNDGLDGQVSAIAIHKGKLYAGGKFAQTADGAVKKLNHLALVDNGAWAALPGDGLDGPVHTLLSRGKFLYVGGNFKQTADGTTATNLNNIVKLDGALLGVPNGGLDAPVYALAASSGVIWVGGLFNGTADGSIKNLNKVAVFDDRNWNSAPNNGFNRGVRAVAINGRNLYLGGDFDATSGGRSMQFSRVAQLPLGANLKFGQRVHTLPNSGEFEVMLTVKNRGPARARQVMVRSLIPSGYVVVSVSGDAGLDCSSSEQYVECESKVLLAGANARVRVRVKANSPSFAVVNSCAEIISKTVDPSPQGRVCKRIPPVVP
jgi:uncharacterized repeat protein (TIGR01451 family)